MHYFKHSLLVFGLLAAATTATAAEWRTGGEHSTLSAAHAQAKRENKAVLYYFTGSDWCSWCVKLNDEVFSKSEFDTFARENLILIKIDFPRRTAQSETLKKVNHDLATKMRVTGFPSLYLFNSEGKLIGHFGYQPGGPSTFIRNVNNMTGKPAPDPKASPVAAREYLPFGGAPTHPPIRYTNLVLKSISGTPQRRFALVNDQTFAPGETLPVKMHDGTVKVRCMEIREQSVLVAVQGEAGSREIKLRK